MRASGLAFRFQYQAGLSSAPAFDANTRYRSSSARYIMMLVRGFPLFAPVVCRITSGAPSKLPPTRPWFARNSAILRSLKSLPSLMSASLPGWAEAGNNIAEAERDGTVELGVGA